MSRYKKLGTWRRMLLKESIEQIEDENRKKQEREKRGIVLGPRMTIRSLLLEGASDEEIREIIKGNFGWSEEEIDRLLEEVRKDIEREENTLHNVRKPENKANGDMER